MADGAEDEAVGGGLVEAHADGGGTEYRAFFFCFSTNREGLREYRHGERRALPAPRCARTCPLLVFFAVEQNQKLFQIHTERITKSKFISKRLQIAKQIKNKTRQEASVEGPLAGWARWKKWCRPMRDTRVRREPVGIGAYSRSPSWSPNRRPINACCEKTRTGCSWREKWCSVPARGR